MSLLHGIFAVKKPLGISSFDVVRRLQRSLPGGRKAKIGHGGTLDPLASGVMVIGVGKGCKQLSRFLSCSKEYVTEGMLGHETSTEDAEGSVVASSPWEHITRTHIADALPRFTGPIMQMPPMYSALKVNGRALYTYARAGEAPPRPPAPRLVHIHALHLSHFTHQGHSYSLPKGQDGPVPPIFGLTVVGGGGLYIRSLVRDIGKDVGSHAYVVRLERTRVGPFTLADSISLEECQDEALVAAAIERCKPLLEDPTWALEK